MLHALDMSLNAAMGLKLEFGKTLVSNTALFPFFSLSSVYPAWFLFVSPSGANNQPTLDSVTAPVPVPAAGLSGPG